ncbi:MAG TPA: hypothetical protein PK669_07780 [Methanosarcina thermophila]|nr:hypothetical protein [Methanosarcina thermophila]HPZ20185.1 hypothetical protein [Methanosarcina thermophila]HQD94582.1 hypothetical protein [Methanosarcina thermophila]
MEENGTGSSIRIIPTEESIEKTSERIEEISESIEEVERTGKEDFGYKEEDKSLNNYIKNIYKVIVLWINCYKHTDCAAGIENIERSLDEKIQNVI